MPPRSNLFDLSPDQSETPVPPFETSPRHPNAIPQHPRVRVVAIPILNVNAGLGPHVSRVNPTASLTGITALPVSTATSPRHPNAIPQHPRVRVVAIPIFNVNAGLGPHGSRVNPTASLSGITAHPVATVKQWNQSINPELRNHLVTKMYVTILRAFFPLPNPPAMLDPRMCNLVAFCRKVEREMYERANSLSEYFRLLSVKICTIQNELEQKRQERRERQQQANATATTTQQPNAIRTTGSSNGDHNQ